MLPRFTVPEIKPEFLFDALSEVYDWGLIDLGIPSLHKCTQGDGIKIAIIDSGKSEHFEVASIISDSRNFTDSNTVNDRVGHGTFVSGIIGASQNNEGIIGVAPKAQLYFAKALDDGGHGNPSDLTRAIIWATEAKVDIISISAGSMMDFPPLHNAIKSAYDQNITIVAAAGNSGNRYYNVAFPARYPEVIGVAAYDHDHKAAPFSSRGINVFCAMPGVDIYSTWLNNQFCKSQGTSFACPIMSGVCALLLSKHRQTPNSSTPCSTPTQVMEHLRKFAKGLADLDKNAVGFGTVDAARLIGEGA